MKGLAIGLLSLAVSLRSAGATVQCTYGTESSATGSGACCDEYTYRDRLFRRNGDGAPYCDGLTRFPNDNSPTCSGRDPICTSTSNTPDVDEHCFSLYCGNPKNPSGTHIGSMCVRIEPCSAEMGSCLVFTAGGVADGYTLGDQYKIAVSTATITSDVTGKSPYTKFSAMPHPEIPVKNVIGSEDTCGKTIFVAFHAEAQSPTQETCWAGNPDDKIGTKNQNWAMQATLTIACTERCDSWCCCPPPPVIQECLAGTESCATGLCGGFPFPGLSCSSVTTLNLPGWPEGEYERKCCCQSADTPTCADGKTPFTGTGPCPSNCEEIEGTYASCVDIQKNKVCCCPPGKGDYVGQ